MKTEAEERVEPPYERMEKSDNSSLLLKDSAYGSLGHSASSSMGPVVPPHGFFNGLYPHRLKRSHHPSSTTPSGGSSSLGNSQTSSGLTSASIVNDQNKIIKPPRALVSTFGRRKIKNNLEKIKEENRKDEEQDYRDSKAVKVATLSQALDYFDQFRKSQAVTHEGQDKEKHLKTLVANLTEVCQGSSQEKTNRSLSQRQLEAGSISDSNKILELEVGKNIPYDSFCVAVSMNTGMVIHTTASLTLVLGYPKDMWIGRNITDFVHPLDQGFFISRVTQNINLAIEKHMNLSGGNKSKNFYCRIRQYSSLRSGFAVKERKKEYKPFKVCVCFSAGDPMEPQGETGFNVFITAVPITSRFKTSDEETIPSNPLGKFTTKHNSWSSWIFVDEDSVPLLGHFPHELEGKDIFDIIHPNDWNIVKDSFELMVCNKNSISKPYRIRTRNLDFVTVITLWTPFINPWNQQLEFIHGRHTIVKGPKITNLFLEPSLEELQEKTIEDKMEAKEKTKLILQNYVRRKHVSKKADLVENKKKSQLSSFMGVLLKEAAKADSFDPMRAVAAVPIDNISLHQSDSSESPPNYNQLNYNENLTRFFNSQPKTLSEKDVISAGVYSSNSSYEDNPLNGGVVSMKKKDQKWKGRSGDSGDGKESRSGQGSGDTTPQLESRPSSSSDSREGVSGQHVLTEDLLVLHNREMEKQMVVNFKQGKRVGKFGFLKNNKEKLKENESKKLQVPEIKASEAAAGRKPELDNFPAHSGDSGEIGQGYQRPLFFSSSSYSGTSPPNIQEIRSQPKRHQVPPMAGPGFCLPPGPIAQSSSGENMGKNYIQVPTIMIPISCASTNPAQVFQHHMPMMVMQGSQTSLFPVCIGDPFPQSGPHPVALPNCLAVNSCITPRPSWIEEKSKDKNRENKPHSAIGEKSAHTSVKGEPGSALESNASGDLVKSRNLEAPRPALSKLQHKSNGNGRYTDSSSQSIYTFLHSSDEIDLADFQSSNSEGSKEETIFDEKARPVLSEPFWNERVLMSGELVMSYQLKEENEETILERDRGKLDKMKQSETIQRQFEELSEDLQLEEMTNILDLFTDNEEDALSDLSEDDAEDADADPQKKKKMNEFLHIFLEEDAPLPDVPNTQKKRSTISHASDGREEQIDISISEIVESYNVRITSTSKLASTNQQTNKLSPSSTIGQNFQFQYGKGMASNKVTYSYLQLHENPEQKKKNRIKDSSDETESSEDFLLTNSSVKTSSGENQSDADQQRKRKFVSSSEST